MSLSTRLNLFFLTALALVLVGFSSVLYGLVRSHLYGQLDSQVATTMEILVAAAEVEPDGLDWEPELRRLPARWQGAPPVWVVIDEDGNRIDGSPEPMPHFSGFPSIDAEFTVSSHPAADEAVWRVARHTLNHPTPEVVQQPPEGKPRTRHRSLTFVTAVPIAATSSELQTLGVTLSSLSIGLWLTATLGSRWFSRRALAPLTRMTEVVEQFSADQPGRRLPLPETRDELARLASSFNDLLSRLEVAFERQRRFTGEASHQLRTPLTVMLGQVEVALRREREPDEYKRVLTTTLAQAERLSGIVESLLYLARAEADARLPDVVETDLSVWISATISTSWSSHSRFNDLTILTKGDSPSWVQVQPALLGQAVDNLVDNAFKYSDSGSPIIVSVSSNSAECQIGVEDRGPGIPTEDMLKVFVPFFRSDSTRHRGDGGVGLGLAITSRIVLALGGQVEVANNPHGGAHFVIRLPRSEKSELPQPATP